MFKIIEHLNWLRNIFGKSKTKKHTQDLKDVRNKDLNEIKKDIKQHFASTGMPDYWIIALDPSRLLN